MSTTASTTPSSKSNDTSNPIPSNKVGLSLLLVNGQRKEGWIADGKETLESFRKRVFEEWPSEWTAERPSTPKQLKFLHRGKFLENTMTFEQNKIPLAEMTVVHLLIMTLDEQDGSGDKIKSMGESSPKCCCAIQ